ncbi:dehydrogenases with different specificities [Candidatus Scalindua japonica]|uniref:Dehydrogenases with different specificities n=1 Tax=Candidatus Scalindua japonica TaxID=1284222 RepID=A0A286TZ17_9BACT|nr:hypothetical protein [Candidatus Scalindua japonica]GAX61127.1 dehydrogenases with different specificities [Candidatus Scalindua japonica]
MKIKPFTTPEQNKEVFINPEYEDIPRLIDSNKERFQSYDFNINGTPFFQFREQVRAETLKKAREYTEKIWSLCSKLKIADTENFSYTKDSYSPDKEIIQTGHSPALAHPGVMIKHSLVNSVAKKTNGVSINMVVDNDASIDNCLNIPNINGQDASVEKIEYIPGLRNLAFEEISYADSKQLTAFKDSAVKALHNPDMTKTFEDFMNVVMRVSEGTLQFSDLFTYARHALLLRSGICNQEIPVSLISKTDSFLHFFLHIAADVNRFVEIYNAKLREYRRLRKISSKANPLPDLMEKGDVVEMPFWVWVEDEQRKNLYASKANEKRLDIIKENRILSCFDLGENSNLSENLRRLKDLISDGIKIRPKAIVNTMYSRMFFSDLFIHGIGGAKYDQITDEIIRDFFGVEPPEYATISATLHLPYTPFDVSKENVNTLKHDIKDMSYNPDRYASDEIMEDLEMRSMVSEKRKLIAKVSHDTKEKHRTFQRLKQINTLMKDKISPLIKKKEKKIENLEKKLAYNSIVTDREYPFCIYPESMLEKLFRNSKR